MSIFSLLGIVTAEAAGSMPAHPAGPMSAFSPMILMLVVLVAFYFMIIRPQNRKRKEQANMINQLSVGDEVATIGGIVGKVSKLDDDFIQLIVASGTAITMQRNAIANILPKGTISV